MRALYECAVESISAPIAAGCVEVPIALNKFLEFTRQILKSFPSLETMARLNTLGFPFLNISRDILRFGR
jgi:hypothetical protein